jgi:epoxyqueuosine reductase
LRHKRAAAAPTVPATDPLEDRIRAHGQGLGFDLVGFAAPGLPARNQAAYQRFLALGRQGDMAWLARDPERRVSPKGLWPEVQSVIVLGMNYGPAGDPLAVLGQPACAAISVYAQGADYHDLVKKRLKQLARWLHDDLGAAVKVFVDTAPVLEKPLGQQAGIGWQGKHTNLVARGFGSWLFLGEVFTDLELAPDPPETDHCGSCRRCLDVCPTDAFPAPYELDSRRCISYLTIEYRGHIDAELRAAIGNRIYGCDDCLAVCPWNKFAEVASETRLHARDDLHAPALAELAALDDAAFRARFRGSPIKRTGRDRFLRNVMIAIGNSGQPALSAVAEARLDDGSALVRAMAVWALFRLLDPAAFARQAARHLAGEADPEVQAEWRRVGP